MLFVVREFSEACHKTAKLLENRSMTVSQQVQVLRKLKEKLQTWINTSPYVPKNIIGVGTGDDADFGTVKETILRFLRPTAELGSTDTLFSSLTYRQRTWVTRLTYRIIGETIAGLHARIAYATGGDDPIYVLPGDIVNNRYAAGEAFKDHLSRFDRCVQASVKDGFNQLISFVEESDDARTCRFFNTQYASNSIAMRRFSYAWCDNASCIRAWCTNPWCKNDFGISFPDRDTMREFCGTLATALAPTVGNVSIREDTFEDRATLSLDFQVQSDVYCTTTFPRLRMFGSLRKKCLNN